MPSRETVLITGAGGVGRLVIENLRTHDVPVRVMVRRDDDRAAELRRFGADVVLGDLTRPETVAAGLGGIGRMYFAMPVSRDHLPAATIVATVARECGTPEALVGMSQMTVSQMTATSTDESHQQRLHWLAEQVLTWSGLPVIHIRPTSFLDNPLFTSLAAQSIKSDGTLALPFGAGRTSPVAVGDVARVAAIGNVYELTGPGTVDMGEMAESFSRALGRPITYTDVPLEQWRTQVLAGLGLPPHIEEHIVTMCRLHQENRYDRATHDIARLTGIPAQTIEQFVSDRKGFYVD